MSSLNLLEISRIGNLIHHDAELTFEDINLQIVLKIINEEHQLIAELQQFAVSLNFFFAMMTPNDMEVVLGLLDSYKKAKQIVVLLEDFWREQEMQRPLNLVAKNEEAKEAACFIVEAIDFLFCHVKREELDFILDVDTRRRYLKCSIDVTHRVLGDDMRVERLQSFDKLVEKFTATEKIKVFDEPKLLPEISFGNCNFAEMLGDAKFDVVDDLLECDDCQLLILLQLVELLKEYLLLIIPNRMLVWLRC